MDSNSKQNALRLISSISMLVAFAASLPIAFVPSYVIDNILQIFLFEPVYTLLVFVAVYDGANGVFVTNMIIVGIVIILSTALTSAMLMLFNKKAGGYCALLIIALDIINRLPLLTYAFNDWNRGLCLLIGLLFKIFLIIVVLGYIRNCKKN